MDNNQKILIISKLLKNSLKTNGVLKFHFKGFYKGEMIDGINTYIYKTLNHKNFIEGHNYIVWGEIIKIEDRVINLSLERANIISDDSFDWP